MGKSALLLSIAVQHLYAKRGFIFIDMYSDTGKRFLSYVPTSRIRDIIYFDPTDRENIPALNILERVPEEDRARIASQLITMFRSLSEGSWGKLLEKTLRYAIFAQLEIPNGSLLGVYLLITDDEYRKRIGEQIMNKIVRKFWLEEYDGYPDKLKLEKTESTLNRITEFVIDPLILNIIGQPKTKIDFEKVLKKGKVIIANLSISDIGEDNARLLSSLLTIKLYTTATKIEHPIFHVIVDDFNIVKTHLYTKMLDSAGKFQTSFTLSNRYLKQLFQELREAIIGTVNTMVVFRVGMDDAETLAPFFDDTPKNFTTIPAMKAYLRYTSGNKIIDQIIDVHHTDAKVYEKSRESIIARSINSITTPRSKVEAHVEKVLNIREG